jgi:hypothetical protein
MSNHKSRFPLSDLYKKKYLKYKNKYQTLLKQWGGDLLTGDYTLKDAGTSRQGMIAIRPVASAEDKHYNLFWIVGDPSKGDILPFRDVAWEVKYTDGYFRPIGTEDEPIRVTVAEDLSITIRTSSGEVLETIRLSGPLLDID